MSKKLISFVVPCYNEEENILNTYNELSKLALGFNDYDYEIIFVDNGSLDRSEDIIRELANKDGKVVAILLSRNFGPEISCLAGQQYAKGDAIIWVEADLQDPIDLIPQFIKKWEDGYDIVLGRRDSSSENRFMFSIRKIFYKILRKMSYIDIPVNVGTFSLIDAKVNKAMNSLKEKNRFGRGIRAWVGFKSCQIEYHRLDRQYGKSSYSSIFEYIRHAEKGLFGFSTLPLELLTYFGLSVVFFSILLIIFYLYRFFVYGNPFTGFSTIVLLVVFFSGMQILAISVLGKYIAIIFEETKNRPHFIVKETINHGSKQE